MKLVDSLPTTTGRVIGNQLVPSGTLVEANDRSAGAGNPAPIFFKLGVVREEAEESGFWLELIIDGNLLKPTLVEPLLTEALELTATLNASIISTKKTPSLTSRDPQFPALFQLKI